MAKVQKPAPATGSKVPPSRMPQRSDSVAGKEATEGMQPIPAAKGKTSPPAAKPGRQTGRR
ncbi:MAG TPA: hypothetical protein VID67_10945 [Rhizomicrobium sp.]|jgi:hypothetical protein